MSLDPTIAPYPSPPPTGPAARHADKPRSRAGWIVTVVLLSLSLVAAGAALVLTYLKLEEANLEIEKQKQLIDEKEEFSAAMTRLVTTTAAFDGTRYGALVPQSRIELLAHRGWTDRWDGAEVQKDTAEVERITAKLTEVLAAAQAQAATNSSGSVYESVIDSLGGGYATVLIDDADTLCGGGDILGCVTSDDPYVVHIDAVDASAPYMTDFIRSGVSYHEFAHVLQMTNPDETRVAVNAFGGDVETMADCFALTYLDGWTLHHRVPVSSFEYYEVDIGYGYTCDETQKQVVRDWYDSLAYQSETITQ